MRQIRQAGLDNHGIPERLPWDLKDCIEVRVASALVLGTDARFIEGLVRPL